MVVVVEAVVVRARVVSAVVRVGVAGMDEPVVVGVAVAEAFGKQKAEVVGIVAAVVGTSMTVAVAVVVVVVAALGKERVESVTREVAVMVAAVA